MSYRAALTLAALLSSTGAAAQAPAGGQPILRAGFIATMDGEYRKLDSNSDGFATRSEVQAQQQRIVAANAAARAQAQFAAIDTDRSGQISPAEFARAVAPPAAPVDVAPIMGRLDSNRDGKVTLVEYRTLTVANFDRLDTDKDGVLTVAEQRAGGFAR